jgi:hypothetical protein
MIKRKLFDLLRKHVPKTEITVITGNRKLYLVPNTAKTKKKPKMKNFCGCFTGPGKKYRRQKTDDGRKEGWRVRR